MLGGGKGKKKADSTSNFSTDDTASPGTDLVRPMGRDAATRRQTPSPESSNLFACLERLKEMERGDVDARYRQAFLESKNKENARLEQEMDMKIMVIDVSTMDEEARQ